MVTALIAVGLVWLAPQDAFVAQRDAAAALNPLSPRFTIALEGDRRSFRIGERIPVVFTYDDISNRGSLAGQPYTHFATAVFDRQDRTADPLADYTRAGLFLPGGICGCVEGGVVGGVGSVRLGYDANGLPVLVQVPPPPPPPKKPVRMTCALNEGVRFDAPGHYRFYILDRHDDESRPLADRTGRPIVSNIVDIEITPRDTAWEEDTARAAMTELEASQVPEERMEAARTLRFLGSDRAVDEILRWLDRDR